MIEMDILECLRKIEASVSGDKYEQLGIWTVGGGNGKYSLKSPVNTEAEYALYGLSTTGAGNVLISQNQFGNALDTTGATSYGAGGGNESNVLEGQFYVASAATTFTPTGELYWQPVGKGSAIYITIGGLTNAACFVLIVWRRLLNRAIPGPIRRPPVTHSLRLTDRPQRMLAAQSQMEANAEEGRTVLPGGPAYHHTLSPAEEHDAAAISRGIAAPLTTAQIVLVKLRGKSGMY